MFNAQSFDERKVLELVLSKIGTHSFSAVYNTLLLGKEEPHIEELAGILQKYANPSIIDREVEIAWQSFADEWRQKNNLP